MADTATLTPKQQQVAEAMFKFNGDVGKAAKKLKITPSGVYGHLRRMKEAGFDQYGARIASSSNGRSSNGHMPPDTDNEALMIAVKTFVESVQAARRDAETLRDEKDEAIAAAEAKLVDLREQREQHDADARAAEKLLATVES